MTELVKPAAIPPGGTIGILGGGQLARMLALAAARLGLQTHIFCPQASAPATQVTSHHTQADYTDETALARFAHACDGVTYEFENVPFDSAVFLERHVPVRPGSLALKVCQDRLTEKTFVRENGIGTAEFASVSDRPSLDAALDRIGFPAILKTRRFGYDGKGQARINGPGDADSAWQSLGGSPSILEAFVSFRRELSIVAARSVDGTVRCYDPSENRHRNHILAESVVPAVMSADAHQRLTAIATRLLGAFEYVGVLAVELFELETGDFVVNELAPRVHNSAHWTLDACLVSQFEQHMRAVAGWPLGQPERHSDAVMTNLLGPDVDAWERLAGTEGLAVHLYGKDIAAPMRKMGHVTKLNPRQTR